MASGGEGGRLDYRKKLEAKSLSSRSHRCVRKVAREDISVQVPEINIHSFVPQVSVERLLCAGATAVL